MKVDTKDKYLKSFVVGRLQERLMNPIIDLVSTIEKYSKVGAAALLLHRAM